MLFSVIVICFLNGNALSLVLNSNFDTETVHQLKQEMTSLLSAQNERINTLEKEIVTLKIQLSKSNVTGSNAFMAEFSQSLRPQGIGYIGFNNIITNVGSAYSVPNFNVPTNGAYYLRFQTKYIPETPKSIMDVHLKKNNLRIEGTSSFTSSLGNKSTVTLDGNFILSLNQGDIIQVHITRNTGDVYMIGGDMATYFMGFRLQ